MKIKGSRGEKLLCRKHSAKGGRELAGRDGGPGAISMQRK